MEVFFWIGFAIAVGFWAESRGRNGVGWGLLACLISPLISGAILLYLPDMKEQEAKIENEIAQQKQAEAEKEIIRMTVRSGEFVTRIEKNFSLFTNSLLTAAEFAERKAGIISELGSKKIAESPEDFLAALIPLLDKKVLTNEDAQKIKLAIL